MAEEGKKNGTQVIQWDYHGGENQLFNFCEPDNITSSSSEMDWLWLSAMDFIKYEYENIME